MRIESHEKNLVFIVAGVIMIHYYIITGTFFIDDYDEEKKVIGCDVIVKL